MTKQKKQIPKNNNKETYIHRPYRHIRKIKLDNVLNEYTKTQQKTDRYKLERLQKSLYKIMLHDRIGSFCYTFLIEWGFFPFPNLNKFKNGYMLISEKKDLMPMKK